MTDQTPAPAPDRPLVTFALFAYNQEEYIREAVEGAFSQTYEPLEIILSDDCSSDRTFEIMQEMATAYEGPHEVKVRRNEVNLGLAGHINAIVASANGEIVCWAAGDDISIPQRTELLARPMLDDSETVGVHSTVREMDKSGNFGKIRSHGDHVQNLTLDAIIFSGGGVVSQAHAFRKVVFEKFGPLKTYLTNEGPAMAFREILLGDVIYLPEPTVLYRIGSGVSTYSGNELNLLKHSEPIKYSKWRLTAIRQMSADLQSIRPSNYKEISEKLSKRERYFENLHNINSGKNSLYSLVSNLILVGFDKISIRAFARVKFPKKIYSAIIYYRNKNTQNL